MAVDVGTAIGYLDLDTSGFKSGFNSAMGDLNTFFTTAQSSQEKLLSLGSAFKTVGSNLTTWVTTPLVGAGTAAMAVGNEFESAMSRVQAISGATKDQLEQLTEQAMELGATTSFSASEAAAGMENLASAGFTVEEIMGAMPGLLNLAASSGSDLATASEIAASAIRGFGLEASSAAHVADVFAEAAARTNAQTEDMGEAMKYIAPVANAMGISLEETAAAIGILSDAGIKGSQAGTTLRSALSRLAKPTDKATLAMEKYGLSFYDAQGNMLSLQGIVEELETGLSGLTQEQRNQALITIFGQEALSGMLVMMEKGPEALGELTESFEQVEGAAEEMANIMLDNTSGALEEMGGALETLAINVQQILAPMVTDVVQWITGLINSFNSLDQGTQTVILSVLGLVAALGPILLIVGQLMTGFSGLMVHFTNLSTAFTTGQGVLAALGGSFGPILAIIAAVAAAVVALKLAWDTNFGGIQEKTAELVEAIQGMFAALIKLLQAFGQMFIDLWESNWGNCQDIVEVVWKGIETAFSSVLNILIETFKLFENIFSGNWEGAWGNVQNIFSYAWTGITALFDGFLKGLLAILTGIGKGLNDAAKAAGEWLETGFSEAWKSLMEWFNTVVQDPVKAISDLGQALYDAGSSIFSSLWDGMVSIWDSIVDWAFGAVSWLQDLFSVEVSPSVSATTVSADGSYATGLDYVPRDMLVKVHQGESIRTKQQTREDMTPRRATETVRQPLNITMTMDGRVVGQVAVSNINDLTDTNGVVPLKI